MTIDECRLSLSWLCLWLEHLQAILINLISSFSQLTSSPQGHHALICVVYAPISVPEKHESDSQMHVSCVLIHFECEKPCNVQVSHSQCTITHPVNMYKISLTVLGNVTFALQRTVRY